MGRRKRGWKAASGLSLDTLKELLEQKAVELQSRREAMSAELAAIDAELGADGAAPRRGPGRPRGTRGPGRPPKNGRRRGPGRPKGSKNGVKRVGKRRGRKAGPKGQSQLHNAIRAALNGSSEPMKLADIAAKVKTGGYATKSKHFPMIVGFRLKEMADVRKAGRGLYSMR